MSVRTRNQYDADADLRINGCQLELWMTPVSGNCKCPSPGEPRCVKAWPLCGAIVCQATENMWVFENETPCGKVKFFVHKDNALDPQAVIDAACCAGGAAEPAEPVDLEPLCTKMEALIESSEAICEKLEGLVTSNEAICEKLESVIELLENAAGGIANVGYWCVDNNETDCPEVTHCVFACKNNDGTEIKFLYYDKATGATSDLAPAEGGFCTQAEVDKCNEPECSGDNYYTEKCP